MRLKVTKLMDGPGPREAVIAVSTTAGVVEQVIVHNEAIKNDAIEIGAPIHRENGMSLVELPRESMSGNWRIWVSNSEFETP